jgi:serine/threonine protein phosphatase 1
MPNRLFAIGDIHGCFEQFQILIEDEICLKKEDKLILLGDYIDRGIQSKEVVDFIIDLQNRDFNIIALLGNHEAMLLDAYNDESKFSLWIMNGGEETLNSFNIKDLKDLDVVYLNFFKSLVYYHPVDQYLFVHAGFNDEKPFDDQYCMLWKSKKSYEHPLLIDKTIVHGHSPVPLSYLEESVLAKKQVLALDTGCVFSDKEGFGKLSALELYSGTVFSV